MRFFTRLSAAVTAVWSIASTAHAHSLARSPLDYLSLVDSPSINTPSHRVHANSEFDITFSLHRNEQRIRLKLEPNHDILPPGAAINYLDEDGNVYKSEPFVREDHRVFLGSSWVETGTEGHWTYAGWARVVVHKDGVRPQFEGAFALGSDSHHIQLRSNFMASKHRYDPDLEPGDDDDDYMLVWRDSDISTPSQGDAYTSYMYGSHDFFFDRFSHELVRRRSPSLEERDVTVRSDAGSWGVFNVRSLFDKRQGIDGSGTSGNTGVLNLRNAIGNTTGCPKTKKVALMGVATDCTYVASFNSSDTARANVINVVNSASAVYESTFNITLGIANLTMNTANCPGSASSAAPWNVDCPALNITQRLTAFSVWRGDQAGSNAFWTLLSNCPTDNEVGLSWTGALCQHTVDANGGTSANVVMKTNTEWQVIAHEVGHTFGAVHDCDSQTCAQPNIVNSQQCCPVSATACDANAQFIMNPSIGSGTVNKFSPCTVGNICGAMGINSVNGSCLVDNSKVPLVTKQQCGNGIVEEGEDCDCGGPEGCGDDSCCNPDTCKFNDGAECDDANEQCCQSCKFAGQGTVCRASTGVCDPQEVCTGSSGTCPADVTAPDGQGCGGGLQCASGQCTSRNLQCKQIMGTSYTDGRNDTYACDPDSCQIRCTAPEFGSNVCYQMSNNFLDGTTCEGDGKCNDGTCTGSSAGGRARAWIDHNKPLVIGIAAGVGGLLLLSILCCIISRCRNRKMRRMMRKSKRKGTPPWPQDNGERFWTGMGGQGMNYAAPRNYPDYPSHPPTPPPAAAPAQSHQAYQHQPPAYHPPPDSPYHPPPGPPPGPPSGSPPGSPPGWPWEHQQHFSPPPPTQPPMTQAQGGGMGGGGPQFLGDFGRHSSVRYA